jgi:hypothetical protein
LYHKINKLIKKRGVSPCRGILEIKAPPVKTKLLSVKFELGPLQKFSICLRLGSIMTGARMVARQKEYAAIRPRRGVGQDGGRIKTPGGAEDMILFGLGTEK